MFNAVLHETTSHRASLLPREPSAAQGYQGWDVATCFQHIRMLCLNRNRVLVSIVGVVSELLTADVLI